MHRTLGTSILYICIYTSATVSLGCCEARRTVATEGLWHVASNQGIAHHHTGRNVGKHSVCYCIYIYIYTDRGNKSR